jgi:hypothetical protein
MGRLAGYSNTTSSFSCFYGDSSGNASTGTVNTFYGANSGSAVTTGAKNSIFGAYSGNQGGLDIRTASNYIVLSDGDGNPRGIFDNTGHFLVGATALTVTGSIITLGTSGGNWAVGPQVGGNGTFYVYNASSAGVYMTYGGTSWASSSDETLKNIIGEIQNGLQKVCSLRAAEFTWKADKTNKPQVGLIAQDVEKVLPEVISQAEENGTLGVQYAQTIPLLVAAIKELKAEIDQLKGK